MLTITSKSVTNVWYIPLTYTFLRSAVTISLIAMRLRRDHRLFGTKSVFGNSWTNLAMVGFSE